MALDPLQLGNIALDPVLVLIGLLGFAVLALLVLVVIVAVHMSRRRREAHESDAQLAELKVRLQTLAEISVSRHGELARAVNERLDRMTHRVGSDLTETARKTTDSIAKLHERLAVIDSAQKNLTDLSSNMVSLQEILANKQARGAFGQMRMEAIIQDGLPKGAFTFQATLSNGKRPDCLLHMPNTKAGVVIDAKFPLEGFEAFRVARAPEEKKDAARRVRVDVGRHVDAMAERYFLPGETQDTAILFVPSEAIYADLAEHFSDLVQKAHRARIVICAPNMLMLAVQTMQAILKDVKMREQAHLIQREVSRLMEDMSRLRERVLDLQRHFGQANQDIEKILTSSERIAARGHKIENLEFEGDGASGVESERVTPLAAPSPKVDEQRRRATVTRQPDLLSENPLAGKLLAGEQPRNGAELRHPASGRAGPERR
jgi:DNA recombination protein RmuC